jgi:hypothetical protein
MKIKFKDVQWRFRSLFWGILIIIRAATRKPRQTRGYISLIVAESRISRTWSRSATTTSLCPSILWSLTLVGLTTWCRILIDMLLVLQLVKKFPSIYGISRYIIVHLFLSRARGIQFTPFQPISWRYILMSCTHLYLGHPSCLFLPPKHCTHFSFLPYAAHSRPI